MDEKKKFSERLHEAMIAAGYEPRPNVLEKHFNALYWGRSVTYQGARRWLIGLSIPEQDKLQVLADWLGVEPHYLRFGTASPQRDGQMRQGISAYKECADIAVEDQATINAYLSLPEPLRKHLRALIAALV